MTGVAEHRKIFVKSVYPKLGKMLSQVVLRWTLSLGTDTAHSELTYKCFELLYDLVDSYKMILAFNSEIFNSRILKISNEESEWWESSKAIFIMLSIFLFLDSDIVVAIAAVVVIGKAGAGADIAGAGIGIGEKEGDLDFFMFYSKKKKERKGEYMGNILSKYNK